MVGEVYPQPERREPHKTRQEIGRRGEELAAAFLGRQGLTVVERNYRTRRGEVDIIAVRNGCAVPAGEHGRAAGDGRGQKEKPGGPPKKETGKGARRFCGRWGGEIPCAGEPEGTVHFVEVKTRTGLEYGTPGTAVTYIKQQRIRTTALHWLQEERTCYPQLSFDVVEIWVLGETAKIRWLPHCF